MRHTDYVPLPDVNYYEEQHNEILAWIKLNAKLPKYQWSIGSSKIYKRSLRPTVRLGVYLSPEDALALRLKFNITRFDKRK